ncbi:MAG TPA: CDP-glycerol glycerophosphotransferase family protein [Prolixibacteraceae bacterium]|nr:CDP-glycerol glycerophosphotransferase family protein [Prolixibacteraceae bacterium]
MSKTIIINRILSDSEIKEITRLSKDGAKIFAWSEGVVPDFAQRIDLTPEEKKEINYEMMAEVLRFGDLPVGDQTVAELFSIDNASVWHYHKFRIYFAVRNLMYFLKPLERNFSSFKDHLWFVSPEEKSLQKLFPEVEFRFLKSKQKLKTNFGSLFNYLVLTKYRFLSYLLSAKKKPEYLIYLTEKYSTVMDKHSLKTRSGHHILEYLISELDGRFSLLTEVLMPKPKGKSDYSFSWKQYKNSYSHRTKIFIEGFLVSGLFKSGVRKSAKKAQQTIRLAYPKVRKTELSTVQKLTLEVFQSLDKSSGFFLFRYFAARNYFKDSGIKAVVAGDENSPLTKSILDAAKFCGIKVIGLQHGTMNDLHPAYLYTANDCKNRVMPDLTLTWGKYWEEFLINKGNYPKESVISVGQIRTDIIPVLLKAEKEKQAKPIDTIVFASQPQRDPELRCQAAFDVFKAARKLPKAQLIVKLHPRESADSEYYSDIAKVAGCKNYIIDSTSDLYQLIASCNVLITCFSTVGAETIYFYKPLIILDHLSQDIQGYAAEGVAFQATNAGSLTSILSAIFRGTLKVDRAEYDLFIQKYACQIDGKVAERCIEAITSAK